jgi:hypothetical protein
MGSGQLVNRLTAQLRDKSFAIALLKKRGDMNPDGSLTAEGLDADAMTAEQRATDRASKKSGKPKSLYTYDSKTNRSTLT